MCCTRARGTPPTRRTTPPASKLGSAPRSTHGGAPLALVKGRRIASQSSGSQRVEARPSLHWRPALGRRFFWRPAPTTMRLCPAQGSHRSPGRVHISPLQPNVLRCHPTHHRLASCISRFRGMVSTLLSAWRKARVVSNAVSPAHAKRMCVPSSSGGPFCSPLSPARLSARLFARLV